MTLSAKIVSILETANLSHVVEELEEMEGTQLDYVDISMVTPGMISFIKEDRLNTVRDAYEEEGRVVHFYEFVYSEIIRKRYATRTKVGRFFGKFYDEKTAYKISQKYMAVAMEDIKIEKTCGNEILDIYHGNNHGSQCGTMEDSCMRYDECQDWLSIYAQEEGISILYSRDVDGYNIARALLWDLDLHGEKIKFLDRIYGSPMMEELYKIHAMKNGYYYKEFQTYGTDDIMFNGKPVKDFSASFQLKGDYNSFPYMDTLSYYHSRSNKIFTNEEYDTFKLDSYEGNCIETCRCGSSGIDFEYVVPYGEDWEGFLCQSCYNDYEVTSEGKLINKDSLWYCSNCGRWHTLSTEKYSHEGQEMCISCKAKKIYRAKGDMFSYASTVNAIVEVEGKYTEVFLDIEDCKFASDNGRYKIYVHKDMNVEGHDVIKGLDIRHGIPYSFYHVFEKTQEI